MQNLNRQCKHTLHLCLLLVFKNLLSLLFKVVLNLSLVSIKNKKNLNKVTNNCQEQSILMYIQVDIIQLEQFPSHRNSYTKYLNYKFMSRLHVIFSLISVTQVLIDISYYIYGNFAIISKISS